MPNLDKVLATLDADRQGALDRLFELLRFKSISTDPAYAPDCAAAAGWLVGQLQGSGFRGRRAADRRPSDGRRQGPGRALRRASCADLRPLRRPAGRSAGTLDQTDPFDPRLVEAEPGRAQIVARGAADDKGQLMTFVEAIRAFRANGGLPCNITILFEGEEESGSTSLPAFIAANAKELKADLMLVCDTNMWDRDTPLITCMLRGLVLEEVVIKAASRDLHSGMFGGAAVNPIHVLARIVAGLHDDQGRITLPGFYDEVPELPPEIKAQWAALKFERSGLSRRRRPVGPGRRGGSFGAGADLGAPDLRRQWHDRRLCRPGLENRAAGPGQRQVLLPPGRQAEPAGHRREFSRLCAKGAPRRLRGGIPEPWRQPGAVSAIPLRGDPARQPGPRSRMGQARRCLRPPAAPFPSSACSSAN